ncbi:MAG: hypothetical protein OXQ29_14515 [Rhodospirillaceae bacterium]|nr:hypothetical protein [Rhodospirillaceae bacterium]
MLSMKTLRVAIVTMGSALLLGPGLAVAQDNINLNGSAAGMDAPMPLVFAQETLPAADAMGRRALEFDDVVNIGVEPRRAIATDTVYLRIDLSGAQFGSVPAFMAGADMDNLSASNPTAGATQSLNSGGAGESYAVFYLGSVPANGVAVVQIPDNTAGGDLMVTTSTGSITATITAYTDPDDALDQVGSRSTFSGSGAIVRLVSGLNVTISPAETAVASVDHGFLWFLGPMGQAPLGWLGIEENLETTMGAVRNATDGVEPLTAGAILRNDGTAPDGMISFNVMGNLDIGAFTVKPEVFLYETPGDSTTPLVLDADGNRQPTETCTGVAEGAVDRGTLMNADGLLIGEEGERPSGVDVATTGDLAPGVYLVCLNVDVMGPETNMYPIPKGDYTATAHFKPGLNSLEASQMAGMEGSLSSIDRNGASVEIPYLTTSEKHNQRLIVVNRGTRPVAITSVTFTSEAGTDVELSATAQAAMDAGLLMVPGQSTYVARMDETIVISGGSRRTAASIAFAATPENLSVATTQVNVSDGSTDTVLYTVE